ncbi:MAG: A24 family peptidase [Rhodocyclaceae bacterium]|nr:A24 family peptidase [Rhodocyclaceae bacterium]
MVLLFALLLGLIIGSFLNVVIHRLPLMMERYWQIQCAELHGTQPPSAEPLSLSLPRSRCPTCAHPIRVLENIPIVSYLWLHGTCRGCGGKISLRYPLVETFTGLLFLLVVWQLGPTTTALGVLLFGCALICLTGIDIDRQWLPDDITLPLLWGGLLFNIATPHVDLQSAVLGAVAGYLSLWSIFWIFKLATGKDGMGQGDFKLTAALGAWLGWQTLPLVILLASLVGTIVGVSLIVFKHHERHRPIPFGPYLALAGMVAMLWGNALTQVWLNLL